MFRSSRQVRLLAIAIFVMAPASATAQQSAAVTIKNKSGVSVRIGADYYIDSNGAKQKLDAYWDIPAGKHSKLLFSGAEILAQKFAFDIITPEGASAGWTLTEFNAAGQFSQELNVDTLQSHKKLAIGPKTPVLAALLENVDKGAKIKSLFANGPAESAGLEVGDIIIAAGLQKVTTVQSLLSAVQVHNPGDHIVVKVLRGQRSLEFEATLGNGNIVSKYPILTAQEVTRLDKQGRVAQINNDIASTRQAIKSQEDNLTGLNFVAIPAAQVGLAAAQQKLKNVQADPKASIGDALAAQLLVSVAEALLNEATNSRNTLQFNLNNNRTRLGKLESDLRALEE